MEIQSHNDDREQKYAAALVVDTAVLAHTAGRWEPPGLFLTRMGNLVGKICVQFYEKYGRAPDKQFVDLIRDSIRKMDRDTSNQMAIFCEALQQEYGRTDFNSAYTLDGASEYFNHVRLLRIRDSLDSYLQAGKTDKAKALVSGYQELALAAQDAVDPILDQVEIASTFASENEDVLIEYPGPLGELLGNDFCREGFVAFEGPDKTGKSFYLLDVVYRGLKARRRVALFDAGDMSKRQIKRRLYARIARRPYRSTNTDGTWPCVVQRPISIEWKWVDGGQKQQFDNPGVIETESKEFSAFGVEQAKAACAKFVTSTLKSGESRLKLSCHPTGSLTVTEIRSKLRHWARQGWVADIVVVDYADILAPPSGSGRLEERSQINANWIALAGLRQEFHCLVVTASQTDTEAYDAWLIDRRNFSGDKRKNSHVTCMIGLNMTPKEKEIGARRLNVLFRREGDYNSKKFVNVAGCLPLANPVMVSCWPSRR